MAQKYATHFFAKYTTWGTSNKPMFNSSTATYILQRAHL